MPEENENCINEQNCCSITKDKNQIRKAAFVNITLSMIISVGCLYFTLSIHPHDPNLGLIVFILGIVAAVIGLGAIVASLQRMPEIFFGVEYENFGLKLKERFVSSFSYENEVRIKGFFKMTTSAIMFAGCYYFVMSMDANDPAISLFVIILGIVAFFAGLSAVVIGLKCIPEIFLAIEFEDLALEFKSRYILNSIILVISFIFFILYFSTIFSIITKTCKYFFGTG